jgi:complement component 1 Q subcomponent-binding protein
LSNEISEESGNQEIDQELVDVQKQVLKVFKLKEEVGLSNVTLTRKHGDEVIEVEFDVQDVEEGDADFDEENPDEEMGANMGINFQVRIKKGDNTMVVDAFASDAMNVRNIRYVDAKHAGEKFESNHYEGPNFEELDENLQAAFYEYLTERNIDDDLSFFVLAYSRDKEQREYVNWLEKVQSFTADK